MTTEQLSCSETSDLYLSFAGPLLFVIICSRLHGFARFAWFYIGGLVSLASGANYEKSRSRRSRGEEEK